MSFFKRKSLFIILIGIIVLGVLVGYSLSNQNNTSTVEKFVMDSVGFIQNIVFQPITFATNFLADVGDIKNTYTENKLLREKIAEYKPLIYELQEMEKENEQLRQTLGLLESPRDYEPILATVIARSPESWMEQIIINQGAHQGIKKNMAVITGEGMIGKVKSVSSLTSSVQLITSFDQLNRISATISRGNADNIFGLIEGYDHEKEMLIFRIIDQSGADVKVDEAVISSNLGGLFPSGLMIGTIKEVTPDQYGLTKIAYVKPAANLKQINEVIVVNRLLESVEDGEEVVDDLDDEGAVEE